MPSQTNPACKVTVGAGTVASKVTFGGEEDVNTEQPLQEYTSRAGSELLCSVENINSNLPHQNHLLALKLIEDSLRDNLKISEVINLIHNEALQNLPNVRQRFFIR